LLDPTLADRTGKDGAPEFVEVEEIWWPGLAGKVHSAVFVMTTIPRFDASKTKARYPRVTIDNLNNWL